MVISLSPALRRAFAMVAVLAVVTVQAGCATEEGGTTGDLSRAAEAAASAASTGRLALDAYLDGAVTAAVADTVLSEMIDASQDAEVAAATRVVEDPEDAQPRRQALVLIRAGTDALVDARAWVGLTTGSDPVALVSALSDSAADLSAFADEWEPQG
ncbi:hypothetical protein EXU48_15490 [Occultella glacieicola]|uniref:DUF4439 domain-containing protein n=1 Tax=Occultella glacieicola TaxID=2518684 RepID=A0ABY2E463_9MICO|nr:hypothetical protein [Occultella glacieicola]TDE91548.1 hypothetical protein EXU48_15490 [Occultella glacieicola]